MPLKFLYFDLGNVLLHFDRQRQYRQMAEVANITPENVRLAMEDGDLQRRYETGELNSHEAFASFCEMTRAECDFITLRRACSDIFWPNVSMMPVIGGLWSAGHRLGVLSNTCASHWEHCTDGRFGFLPRYFEVAVLSYEVRSMKPAQSIYAAAASRIGLAPKKIFFVDDRFENVQAATEFGLDAVQFTSTKELVVELRKRNIQFNY